MRILVMSFSFTVLLLLCLGMVYSVGLSSVQYAEAQYDDGDDGDDIPVSDGAGIENPGGAGITNPGPGGGGGTGSGSLINPIKANSIPEFLIAVIEILLIFAVPIIVLFIMYAGFLYVTARGDTSQISKAHAALTWSVVGGVIVLGALLIVEVIKGTIESF